MEYVISHDVGTTGDKACLFDRQGNLVHSVFHGYPTHYGPSGVVEQDAEDWWRAVCEATRELLSGGGVKASDVACIAFSGQMMGCLPVDENNNPLRHALIWADHRAIAQADRLRTALGGDEVVYRITGQKAVPTFSAAKILWVRDEEPEIYRLATKFAICKDFLIARLTGQWVTDPSDASGTNLYDLRRGNWSHVILSAVDLDPSLLPVVRPSTAIAGRITQSAGRATGLVPGTPVVQGGGDGECAAVGAGAVSVGDAYLYLGSSGWLASITSEPLSDPQMRLATEAHVVPGLFSPNGTTQNCGSCYRWLRDLLLPIYPSLSYAEMDQIGASSPPGSRGLLFLPYLLGERTPYVNPLARGAFLGLAPLHGLSDLIRAVLEGVAFNFAIIAQAMEENGVICSELRVIGGGALSRLWLSILSDTLNVRVIAPQAPAEASSWGAAICGGVGVGLWKDFSIAKASLFTGFEREPDPENVNEYAALIPKFKEAYQATVEVNAALARRASAINLVNRSRMFSTIF